MFFLIFNYVDSAAHYHMQSFVEMVSNVMLLITVVFGGVLSVGGGVWERLHSVHVMNSSSPEPVWYNTAQQCFT